MYNVGYRCRPLTAGLLNYLRLYSVSQKRANFGKRWFWQTWNDFDNFWQTAWAHFQKLYAYSTFLVPSLLLDSFAATEMTRHRRLEAAPHWTLWSSISQNVIAEAVDQWKKRFRKSGKSMREGKRTNTLNICQNKNGFFSEPPAVFRATIVYRGKRVMFRVISVAAI